MKDCINEIVETEEDLSSIEIFTPSYNFSSIKSTFEKLPDGRVAMGGRDTLTGEKWTNMIVGWS